jgi:hypothetical protein
VVAGENNGGSGYHNVVGRICISSHGPTSSSSSRADWSLALNRPIQPDSLGLAVLGSRRARQSDWDIATAANLACSVLICMPHRSMSSVLLGQL